MDRRMGANMVHVMVLGMGSVTAVLIFCLLYAIQGQMGQVKTRAYNYIGSKLKARREGIFDYGRLETFLKAVGAPYLLGRMAEPVRYTGLCVVLAALGAMIGAGIHPLMAIPGALFGANVLRMLLLCNNRKDNDRMLPQMKQLYQFLGMQTASGIYLTDALTECYGTVEDRRLKDGLYRLANEILISGETGKALDHFRQGFDNVYIDTLCIVLKQAMESGQASVLLGDIAEQVKDVEENLLYQKQAKLERKNALFQTLFLLGMASAIIVCAGQGVMEEVAHFYF